MIDVMIDLETLGTAPGSVVMSIGAVASTGDEYLHTLSITEQLHAGLLVDADTLSWWRKQSRDVWQASSSGCVKLSESLAGFAAWLQSLRAAGDGPTGSKLRLWGDAASFDLTLLACVYRAGNVPVPWSYREECCYRTLRSVLGSEKPASKVQHDGLSDAKAQMAHLQQLLAQLNSPLAGNY